MLESVPDCTRLHRSTHVHTVFLKSSLRLKGQPGYQAETKVWQFSGMLIVSGTTQESQMLELTAAAATGH